MARVTIEDTRNAFEGNDFEMILAAAKRARQLANGVTPLVPANGDKPTVLALREIAAGFTDEDFNKNDEEEETDELED